MRTFLLTIAYDGTDYHGWQRQDGQKTVQAAVENALAALTGQQIAVTASGRTDESVHALGQTVSFACQTSIPAQKFPDALNAYLPRDIHAVACAEVADGFCARRSAKQKTYVYRMYLAPTAVPQWDRYALHLTKPLHTEKWQEACARIAGTHDFAAFYCLGSSAKTTVRTVYSCSFVSLPAQGIQPSTYEFTICGNGFLYKMVRLLVGALLQLEEGKITADDFAAAIDGDISRLRKIPAPSKGLTLYKVEYEKP